MDIVLAVALDADGRLTGTASGGTGGQALGFSGNLELLAAVERLCAAPNSAADPDDSPVGPRAGDAS